jgi:hypothetical protein
MRVLILYFLSARCGSRNLVGVKHDLESGIIVLLLYERSLMTNVTFLFSCGEKGRGPCEAEVL